MKTKSAPAESGRIRLRISPITGREIVSIAELHPTGVPWVEAGPVARLHAYADRVVCGHVLGDAMLTVVPALPKSTRRPFCVDPFKTVYVFSDSHITPETQRFTAAGFSRSAGCYTTAQRALACVRWIPMSADFTESEIARMAANEIWIARSEDRLLRPEDVLILLWRACADSFGEVPLLEIGRSICDAVFTSGCDSIPPFIEALKDYP